MVSDKWADSFLSRNGLSPCRRTNLTTLTDDILVGRAVSTMQFLMDHTPDMVYDRTTLMNETALIFEDARSTVGEAGSHR